MSSEPHCRQRSSQPDTALPSRLASPGPGGIEGAKIEPGTADEELTEAAHKSELWLVPIQTDDRGGHAVELGVRTGDQPGIAAASSELFETVDESLFMLVSPGL